MTEPYYQDDLVTLYHGDCREIDVWESAHLLLTDPPYGIGWTQGRWNRKLGRAVVEHAGIANDHDLAARDYVVGQWGQIKPALVFGASTLPPPYGTRSTLVWRKGGDAGLFGMIAGWRRDWEAIYLLGNWPASNAARSSIIATSVGTKTYINGGHPHTKPTPLLELLLQTAPPGAVADPFAGSGSTLVAARNLGRKAIGVEIDEAYCELIARRLDQGCLDFGEVTA